MPLSYAWLPNLWLGLMLSRVTTYILSSNCQCQSLPNDRICLLGNWQFNDLPCLRSPVYLKMSKLTGKGEERTEISGRGWFWLKQLLSRTPKYVPPLRLDSLGWENNTRWCSWHKAPLPKPVHSKESNSAGQGRGRGRALSLLKIFTIY